MNDAKIKVVKQYMSFFDELIQKEIKKDNEMIYNNLQSFLQNSCTLLKQTGPGDSSLRDMIQKEQASQIPTCLVITSTESASSIETQF